MFGFYKSVGFVEFETHPPEIYGYALTLLFSNVTFKCYEIIKPILAVVWEHDETAERIRKPTTSNGLSVDNQLDYLYAYRTGK